MAKKIRFPLEMENGIEVRTIEELKDNFSLEKILIYISNGKLVTWLKDRYLNDIADALLTLNQDEKDYKKKVCDIFDVEYDKNYDIDLESIREKQRKIEMLKEYTDDESFLEYVEQMAFDQDDLYDLLDEDVTTVYLCGEKFAVPHSKKDMTYIGVNNPEVIISSKQIINFEKQGIEFNNIHFNQEYLQLTEEKQKQKLPEKLSEILKNKETVSEIEEETNLLIQPVIDNMLEYVDDFLKEIDENFSERFFGEYEDIEGVYASDYSDEEYDFNTKAEAKVECKEKIQEAFDDLLYQLEDVKDELADNFYDMFSSELEDEFKDFTNGFMNSLVSYLSLECDESTKNEVLSENVLKEWMLKVRLDDLLEGRNEKAILKEIYDIEIKKQFKVKKYFDMCTYEKDDGYYCYQMEDALYALNNDINVYIENGAMSFCNRIKNCYIEMIKEYCSAIKEDLKNLGKSTCTSCLEKYLKQKSITDNKIEQENRSYMAKFLEKIEEANQSAKKAVKVVPPKSGSKKAVKAVPAKEGSKKAVKVVTSKK